MADESGAETSGKAAAPPELPAIDFSTFVLSLSTTALYQMGLLADPETHEKASPNREIAQQTIPSRC